MPPDTPLLTPVYIKTGDDMPWPSDDVFFLLSRDGLFLCRNHPFFRSSVPARRWPSELAEHKAHLALDYPPLPRRLLERVIGFFARIAELHNAEAAVLLAWDPVAKRVRVVVPDQLATVGRSWHGETYPINVHYEVPMDLPDTWTLIGDIHSHVDEAAYASATDCHDEKHRPGLHIVIGKISREPPQVHIEAVVDGTRFDVDPSYVLDHYQKRRMWVPQAWIDKVQVKVKGWNSYSSYDGWGKSNSYGGGDRSSGYRDGGSGSWNDHYSADRREEPDPPKLEAPNEDKPPGDAHERPPPTSA